MTEIEEIYEENADEEEVVVVEHIVWNKAATPSNSNQDTQMSNEEQDFELCLCCSERVNLNEIERRKYPPLSPENECIYEHLWNIFVLRNVLGFPASECRRILRETSGLCDPGKWYELCDDCFEVAKNALVTHQKIVRLSQEMGLLRYEMGRRLKESFGEENGGGEEEDDCGMDIRQEIRNFIKGNFDSLKNEVVKLEDSSSEKSTMDFVEESTDDETMGEDKWNENGRGRLDTPEIELIELDEGESKCDRDEGGVSYIDLVELDEDESDMEENGGDSLKNYEILRAENKHQEIALESEEKEKEKTQVEILVEMEKKVSESEVSVVSELGQKGTSGLNNGNSPELEEEDASELKQEDTPELKEEDMSELEWEDASDLKKKNSSEMKTVL